MVNASVTCLGKERQRMGTDEALKLALSNSLGFVFFL